MTRRRFHDWREWRRFQALRLARRHWKHRDIADALGISEGAVSRWLSRGQERGAQALRSQPHTGHPKLPLEQKHLIPDFLWHRAGAAGVRWYLGSSVRGFRVNER